MRRSCHVGGHKEGKFRRDGGGGEEEVGGHEESMRAYNLLRLGKKTKENWLASARRESESEKKEKMNARGQGRTTGGFSELALDTREGR